MTEERFWQIVERATKCVPVDAEDWDLQLIAELKSLPADEILAWDRIFSSLTEIATN